MNTSLFFFLITKALFIKIIDAKTYYGKNGNDKGDNNNNNKRNYYKKNNSSSKCSLCKSGFKPVNSDLFVDDGGTLTCTEVHYNLAINYYSSDYQCSKAKDSYTTMCCSATMGTADSSTTMEESAVQKIGRAGMLCAIFSVGLLMWVFKSGIGRCKKRRRIARGKKKPTQTKVIEITDSQSISSSLITSAPGFQYGQVQDIVVPEKSPRRSREPSKSPRSRRYSNSESRPPSRSRSLRDSNSESRPPSRSRSLRDRDNYPNPPSKLERVPTLLV